METANHHRFLNGFLLQLLRLLQLLGKEDHVRDKSFLITEELGSQEDAVTSAYKISS